MHSSVTLIRCTKKLLNELGIGITKLSEAHAVDPVFDEWYCNLLYFDRCKSLLFTNTDTLYAFLVPRIRKKDLEDFYDLFSKNLRTNLEYEGLSTALIEKIFTTNDVVFGKTIDRSVLGSMNEYAAQCEYYTQVAGGIENMDLLELNQKLNETPMSAIGMNFPIELIRDRLLNT